MVSDLLPNLVSGLDSGLLSVIGIDSGLDSGLDSGKLSGFNNTAWASDSGLDTFILKTPQDCALPAPIGAALLLVFINGVNS